MSIRVMVVDDEPIAAKATAVMIRRVDPDMEVAAVCYSGREAVSKAALLHPDLVIMDIQMPGINGLEAMKRIREHSPGVSFIVLSAYSEFSYAVEALSMGACDYLLKPVKQVNFSASLQRAAADILAKKEDMDQELQQQERMQIAIPMIRKDFVRALAPDAGMDERLIVCAGFLGVADRTGFAVALVQLGDGGIGPLKSAVDSLSHQGDVIGDVVRPGLAAAFVTVPDDMDGEAVRLDLYGQLQERLSRAEGGQRVLAGLGEAAVGPTEMKASMRQAIAAVEYLRGLGDPQRCCAFFDAAVMDLAAGGGAEEPPVEHSSTTKIIEKATRYIEENHHREITLDEVASAVNLSPFYFSRFFKEYTGTGFSERLMQVRIARAKELLAMPDSSVKDVAFQVGYNDPNYFSRVFRKATGIKASDYRAINEKRKKEAE